MAWVAGSLGHRVSDSFKALYDERVAVGVMVAPRLAGLAPSG